MGLVDFLKKALNKENPDLKKRIFKVSTLSQEQTEKIWQKYFRFIPFKLILPLVKYNLNQKKVLDVGSAWGEFLIHFGPGSKGIEVLPESVEFSRALGLEVSQYNFEDEWQENRDNFDAVWCSNVLEHVVAPHLLLRRFHNALKPEGLVFIRVPTVPSNWFYLTLNRLLLGFLGYEALQHINAFTRRTLEFTVERAGFKIIESNIFIPKNKVLNRLLNPILKDAISFVTVVAQKTSFVYPEKRPDLHNPKWLDI